MFFCWFYWKKMLSLRQAWFMSAKFQRSISSRSLMVRIFSFLSLFSFVVSSLRCFTTEPLISLADEVPYLLFY